MKPLVSVVCVCYNHARFVVEALESVKAQTYPNAELIIVDDGSSDDSAQVIKNWLRQNPSVPFVHIEKNMGYTKAFNKAFRLAKGEFYIDLAADDVLLPDRIEKGVDAFCEKGSDYAIQFGDANIIDVQGKWLGKHSDRFPHAGIPQGDVYTDVIHRYFICSPTMLVRKSVVNALGGYDETLHYEDFDLWVRVARTHKFFYLPEALINRRLVPRSLGNVQYSHNSKQLESTFKVCEKIFLMNRNRTEHAALNKRIFYEFRQNLKLFNWGLCLQYAQLYMRNLARGNQ
jgi:glycosyltransferase involved in cell wall biosynthesis